MMVDVFNTGIVPEEYKREKLFCSISLTSKTISLSPHRICIVTKFLRENKGIIAANISQDVEKLEIRRVYRSGFFKLYLVEATPKQIALLKLKS